MCPPLIVNLPGNGLDTAGQGLAAAQDYRGQEQRMKLIDQEAAQRSEKFALEKDIALRSIQMDEEKMAFEKEQLAQQQEAAGDFLAGLAIQAGHDVGDRGAYAKLLSRMPPDLQERAAVEFGRSARVLAEQAEMNEIVGTLDLTPETKALVESGQLRDPKAIRRAQQKEKWKLAQSEFQEIRRASALEGWQAWTKDPSFDMPTEDDEAYDDVMTLLGEIGPGAATNAKTDYGMLMNKLRLLTTKGMRDAARSLLEYEMGGMDAAGLPKGALTDALGDPGMQANLARGQQMAQRAGEFFGVGKKQSAAQAPAAAAPGVAAPGAEVAQPAAEGETPVATKDLKAPAQRIVSEDQANLARTALANLGMKTVPPKGTPERAKLEAEITKLDKQRIDDAANKPTRGTMQ